VLVAAVVRQAVALLPIMVVQVAVVVEFYKEPLLLFLILLTQ
jgi:hypothetical protein